MPQIQTIGLWERIERFWFRPVSASGFGMMRVAYGLTAFMVFALQWNNVPRYYSDHGMMPHAAMDFFLRPDYRFTILGWIMNPADVSWLYLLLLASLILVTLGIWTRAGLIVSTVLLYSFHEYNPVLLDGGDTLLRLIGLILLLSPCDRTFTLGTLRRRLRSVVQHGEDQAPSERTMAIWPYRLLLWQMICIYISSTWEKLSGTTWPSGSAVAIVLHHTGFSRIPPSIADALTPFSPLLTYSVLVAQVSWILLLILPVLTWYTPLPKRLNGSVKRTVIAAGFLMHLGITLTMDVGLFSFVIFTAYLGLLLDDDFRAIRNFFNWSDAGIVVLFDGTCGLCRRSVVILKVLDWLHRLQFADFTDERVRKEHAPDIRPAALEKAMHIKLTDGSFQKGFRAFRALCWNLPPLWVLAPLLYIPGMTVIGDWVYDNVASRRMRCGDGACRI